MNTNTGEILNLEDLKKLNLTEDQMKEWVEVEEEQLTKKQKKEQLVSLFDHRSSLGKQLTDIRSKKSKKAKRRAAKKSRKNNRK